MEKKNKKTCIGVMASGIPCKNPAVRGDYCLRHCPETKKEKKQSEEDYKKLKMIERRMMCWIRKNRKELYSEAMQVIKQREKLNSIKEEQNT